MVVARVPPSLRLFLALWPDAALRGAMAQWQQAWAWPPGAKLVAPGQLHLTLHFLGNVAAARLGALHAGLRVPFDPFELQLGDAKVWPGGIAVLRPQQAPPALLVLHARLATALAALDFAAEPRQYKAHVTLARRAAGAVPPPGNPAFTWRANAGYVLVRTLPDGGGYEVLERFS